MIINIIIIFGLLIIFISSGMWIAIALATTGIITLAFLAGGYQHIVDVLLFNTISSFVLVAVPMFIFLGEIVLESGLSKGLYRGVSKWTSIIPGGLLHSNIMACSLFAAISGSSLATAATIGTVAYEDQKAKGYDYKLLGGSIAAGGTLGILIPPSIIMIIYGDFVGASVAKLFAGGVVPGVIASLLFMSWLAFITTIRPNMAPHREKFTRRYFLRAAGGFKDVWPILVIIVIIFVGIYGGLMTPSEAAAVSCFVALLLSAIFRKLNFNMLKGAALRTLRTSAMVLFIVVCAKILGMGVSMIKLPAELSEFVGSLGIGRMGIWVGIIILYLALGCLMDALAMMLLTLPVTYQLIVLNLGFDPIWFGVALVLLTEIALITPPVGLNLYIVHGISQNERMESLVAGIIPFFFLLLIVLGLLTIFPVLVSWLPNILMPKY
ncbi:TRAP transporter large permease [Chloroflexota bacterium]